VELLTQNEMPYILFTSDFDYYHAAQYFGLIIDIRNIIKDYEQENFYLPVISFSDSHPEVIQNLINQEISIQHELIHIKDFFNILDKNPDYTGDLMRYGLFFEVKNEDLEKSIDFEVRKLFLIEPNGLTHDYNNNERLIYDQFMGRLMKYSCSTLEEYLQMKMLTYIDEIKSLFKNKFKNENERIETEFEKSINKYGTGIFNDNPYQNYKSLKEGYSSKLLSYTISSMKEDSHGR
ncbi:MAG: hypothetical protein KDK45_22830, partial [Leptospiraceae bacterium]|nr:hypothetical protein [Leptospiraceae bacterium]